MSRKQRRVDSLRSWIGGASWIWLAAIAFPSVGVEAMGETLIPSLNGGARVSMSCENSIGLTIKIAGYHRPPIVPPPMLRRGTENKPIVTYAVDGRGPFEEEWARSEEGVSTRNAAQARFFLSRLLGSRFLFVSIDGMQSFEFDLHRQGDSPLSSLLNCRG